MFYDSARLERFNRAVVFMFHVSRGSIAISEIAHTLLATCTPGHPDC